MHHPQLKVSGTAMAETSQMEISSSSILSRTLEETQWVIQIRELVERDDLQKPLQIPTSIFKLPHSVTSDNPEAYFPAIVALGPYHHFRPDLYKMEIYKLESAREAREKFQLPAFNQIVDELKPLELQMRAFFDKYLEMESETLAWTMVIDGLFLLRLLAIFSPDGKENHGSRYIETLEFPLQMFKEQKLYDGINGSLMSQCEIVNDILKLENQIPVLVLKEILPRNLHVLFYQFCELVSPIKLPSYDYYNPKYMDIFSDTIPDLSETLERSHHLLHFLYLLMIKQTAMEIDASSVTDGITSFLLELLNLLASISQVGFLQQMSEAIGLIQTLVGLLGRRANRSSSAEDHNPPIIPSASKLKRVGLKFSAGIKGTRFDKKTVTLALPAITMNPFSEVMIRNLVAFEVATKVEPPCFTQYTALMTGLIATAKDITILKKARIINICSNFGSDEEVVKVFNGLRKAIGSHFSSSMESDLPSETGLGPNSNPNMVKMAEIIKEINQYYESCWRVKARRFVGKYIRSVLKTLFFLVIILAVTFVIVRTFCGWFSCPKILSPN